MILASLAALLLLVLVHLVTPSLRFLDGAPRTVWLSAAGGVSVAYVFVHLLPELAEAREVVSLDPGQRERGGRGIFLVALAGLLVFYGLDRLAKTSRGRDRSAREAGAGAEEDATSPAVFWTHMASFAVYNLLVGYLLLHREGAAPGTLPLFAAAMALHFVVTDYGLAEDHKTPYRRLGRWLLAGAATAGWVLGLATELPEAWVAALTAFLGGGVVLNVLKEEVPSERQSRFWAFAGGAAGYAALLLAV